MGADYDPTVQSTFVLQGKLAQHVLMKGYQAGGLIGLAAAVPIQAVLARSFSVPKAARTCGISSLVGVGLTGALLGAKMTSIDRAGYEDRVYRLHYNKGQNRCDTMSTWGALLGLAASAAAANSGVMAMTAMNLLGGSAAGSALGVLLHVATSSSTKEENKQAVRTVLDQTKLGKDA